MTLKTNSKTTPQTTTIKRSGLIRFNAKQRMRTYRGQERTFNISRLMDAVNSSAVQERVRKGDMQGYYGHWPRRVFGMEPEEGGIVDGKVVTLEPSHRIIYLRGYDNGDIEHEVEFLDNETGRTAYQNHMVNKVGGFSTVISGRGDTYSFHGMDFVMEPNFSGNRAFATLDSVNNASVYDVVWLDGVNEADDLSESQVIRTLKTAVLQLKEQNNSLTQALNLSSETLDSVITERDTQKNTEPSPLQHINAQAISQEVKGFLSLTLDAVVDSDQQHAITRQNRAQDDLAQRMMF
jgi:hypothetical protein